MRTTLGCIGFSSRGEKPLAPWPSLRWLLGSACSIAERVRIVALIETGRETRTVAQDKSVLEAAGLKTSSPRGDEFTKGWIGVQSDPAR